MRELSGLTAGGGWAICLPVATSRSKSPPPTASRSEPPATPARPAPQRPAAARPEPPATPARPAAERPADWLLELAAGALGRLPVARAAVKMLGLLPAPPPTAEIDPLSSSSEGVLDALGRATEVIVPIAPARPDLPCCTRESPAVLLAALLNRSLDQAPEEAERDLFMRILSQIVPDEARILAALSDGGSYPLIDVCVGSAIGGHTRTEVGNISSIGLGAGAQLTEMTPHYVERLAAAGVIEFGPEDESIQLKYELLESQSAVLKAFDANRHHRLTTKVWVERRTVRLSPLGRRLWAACQESGDPRAAG